MKLQTIAFLSVALILSACSGDTTSVNNNQTNNNGNGGGNNNNGATTTTSTFVAKVTRYGSAVPTGSRPAACDIFWLDSAGHEHSFLNEAQGKVALLCVGGLWTVYSNPMFNVIDTIQKFYGSDSVCVLRAFAMQAGTQAMLADSVHSHGWKGRFVFDSSQQLLTKYANAGATGVPYTAIIDRNGRIVSSRLGTYTTISADSAAHIFERQIDSVKKL